MYSAIGTAVIPLAGHVPRDRAGAVAKEMGTVADRPALHHVVDEMVDAGVTDIVFVVRCPGGGARGEESPTGATAERAALAAACSAGNEIPRISFVRQRRPLGLGDALRRACTGNGAAVAEAPFVLALPDEIFFGRNATRDLIEAREKLGGTAFVVDEVDDDRLSDYGVLVPDPARPPGSDGIVPAEGIVEKPGAGMAPSCLAAVGRYVIGPGTLEKLAASGTDPDLHLGLADVLGMGASAEPLHGVHVRADRVDLGLRDGFARANLVAALNDPGIGKEFTDFLHRRLACRDAVQPAS